MKSFIKLGRGDCLELMKKIPSGSVDMVLTDPPYGTTACKWDVIIAFEPMWEQLKRITKDNGAIVLFGSEPFSSHLRLSNLKMYKYDWIWEKEKGTGFARSKKQPLRKHELIHTFYNNQPYYDYLGEKLKKPYTHTLPVNKSNSDNVSGSGYDENKKRIYKTYTHSSKHSIIKISRDSNRKSLHPTQKPVDLLEYLIKTYTLENETVLDFTMGSGSTGVACKNLNRKFIGIEKDETYFEIAKKRINEAGLIERVVFGHYKKVEL